MEHMTKVGVWRRLIATCFEVVLWLAKRNTNSAPSPCHEPFQAVPLSNPFQSAGAPGYFALTLGCVQGLHKGPIDFGTKDDHQKHHRAWLSQTDTGRLSSASIDEVTLTNYVGGHLMDRLSMCKQPCHSNNHFKCAKNHNWFRSGRFEKKHIISYNFSKCQKFQNPCGILKLSISDLEFGLSASL